jgi:SNF2 family DNA or RNA helicase
LCLRVEGQNLPSLLNVMMELRKCCNHPFLVKGVEEIELADKKTPEEINQAVIQASGKLVLIDKLLPKLKVHFCHRTQDQMREKKKKN